MDQDSAHIVAASKIPMLKPGKFGMWRMRIEQYIQCIDYALWEVIENGNSLPKTQLVNNVMTLMPLTITEEKAQKRLEMKARSTLMMSIPNEHQLEFNSIKDAKLLMEAIKKRFGRNDATKKTQKNLLKQQNITDLETMSMDDLYNNLKVFEPEVKGMSSSSSSTQYMAFVHQLAHEDLEQIHPDDVEEIDLKWQMAMLTMRTRRFLKNTRRKLSLNTNETIGFDKSKLKCYNCHKKGHFARECRALRNQDYRNKDNSRKGTPVETFNSTTLVSCNGLGYDWSDQAEEGPNYALMAYSSTSYKSGLESVEEKLEFYKKNESSYVEKIHGLNWEIQVGELTITELRKKLEIVLKEKDSIQLNVDKFENASKSLNKLLESQILDNCKKDEFANKPNVESSKAKSSEVEPKVVRKDADAPIIKDCVSDDEEEYVA
ncbi:ribonuclease H-like domain-containing protein [Tanacetum coccineum]|uniref:Ribonuclease H-like domain-containing protein n=1 Tax=Tanacetum coccineum TaxID=301880 RepID=A0ABQ5J8U2_9ASTR